MNVALIQPVQLKREYDRIVPSLKAMLEKERERKNKFAEANQGLGVSQAFHFGEVSNYECVFSTHSAFRFNDPVFTRRSKITALEDQILALASRLDLTLGRPSAKP
jgi:nucleoporin NUP82